MIHSNSEVVWEHLEETHLSTETAARVKMLACMVRKMKKCTSLHSTGPNSHRSRVYTVAWTGTQSTMKPRSASPRLRMNRLVVFIAPFRHRTASTRELPAVPSRKSSEKPEDTSSDSVLHEEEEEFIFILCSLLRAPEPRVPHEQKNVHLLTLCLTLVKPACPLVFRLNHCSSQWK